MNDGKAGDRIQCEGVAQGVLEVFGSGRIEHRRIHPRPAFAWMAPWGPMDPSDRAAIARPFPDLVIATGRRVVPAFRHLAHASPATVAVFLKDPRMPLAADLIWVPAHDGRRGPNVLVTPTSPHTITGQSLAVARRAVRRDLADLPRPRVAVLLGGPSGRIRFTEAEIALFVDRLRGLAQSGAGLMVTPSRRTPPAFLVAVREALAGSSAWIWDGEGDNPYLEMLALADAFVVTGDSMNMIGEAAVTGRPIHVAIPNSLRPRHRRAIEALQELGAVVEFFGQLESHAYEPLNATPDIVRAVVQLYLDRKQPLGAPAPGG